MSEIAVGLAALIVGLALLAGLSAFAIDYDEGLRRFERARARRRALATGLVAASFFGALGLVLALVLLR